MGNFHAQNFGARYAVMGDPAEQMLERCVPRSAPFGFNRPPFSIQSLPIRLRHAPDRVAPECFYEATGCGRDQTIKVKQEKLSALLWWNDVLPVELFVYDMKKQRWGTLPIRTLQRWVTRGLLEHDRFQETTAEEPEGRLYWKIPTDKIDNWQPCPAEEAAA